MLQQSELVYKLPSAFSFEIIGQKWKSINTEELNKEDDTEHYKIMHNKRHLLMPLIAKNPSKWILDVCLIKQYRVRYKMLETFFSKYSRQLPKIITQYHFKM